MIHILLDAGPIKIVYYGIVCIVHATLAAYTIMMDFQDFFYFFYCSLSLSSIMTKSSEMEDGG